MTKYYENKYKNAEFEIKDFYDKSKKFPKTILINTYPDEIIHGGLALNKQIGIPELRNETFDIDIFSDRPLETAKRQLSSLNKIYGNIFTLEKGRTEGLFKIKLKWTKQSIADIMKKPKGIRWIKIKGKKFASLDYFKKHIKKTLKNPANKWRTKKDTRTLNRILKYEKNYKNITKFQFRKSLFLQKKFGKYKDSDGDGKLNLNDCYPFDPLRQDFNVSHGGGYNRNTGAKIQAGVKSFQNAQEYKKWLGQGNILATINWSANIKGANSKFAKRVVEEQRKAGASSRVEAFNQREKEQQAKASLMQKAPKRVIEQNINYKSGGNQNEFLESTSSKSSSNGGLYSSNNNSGDNIYRWKDLKKSQHWKEYGKEIPKRFLEYSKSLGRGLKKDTLAPYRLIRYGENPLLRFKDPDIQNLYATIGLGGLSKVPMLGKAIFPSIVGMSGYETIKNPSPENLADFTLITTLPKAIETTGKWGSFVFNKGSKTYDLTGYKPLNVEKGFRQEYKDYSKVANTIKDWKPEIKDIDMSKIGSIKGDKKLQVVIKRGLKGGDDILGGTGGISSADIRLKKIGDIDLYSSNPSKSVNKWATIFKKNNIDVRKEGNGFYYKGKKILEINDNQVLLSTQRTINPNIKTPEIITSKSNIKIANPKYLILRKWLGGFERGKGQNLYRYSKDIPRFVEASEQVIGKQLLKAKELPPFVKQYKQFKVGRSKAYLEPYKDLGKRTKIQPEKDRAIGKRPNYITAGLKEMEFGIGKRGSYYGRIPLPRNKRGLYYLPQYPKRSPEIGKYPLRYIETYPKEKYGGVGKPTPYKYKYYDTTSETSGYIPRPNNYPYDNYIIPEEETTNKKRNIFIRSKTKITKTGMKRKWINKKIYKDYAHIPVMVDEQNRFKVEGLPYKTHKGAMAEGMESTDRTPFIQFKVVKRLTPRNRIRKGRETKIGYKFRHNRGMNIERKKYRKDRRREKNNSSFNWMKFLKAGRIGYNK